MSNQDISIMSEEEQLKTTKSYWSCNINAENFSLESPGDLINNVLTIEESKGEEYTQIDSLEGIDLKKESQGISLVSIEGQIYAFKNDEFQSVEESEFLDYNNQGDDNILPISEENDEQNETTFEAFSEDVHNDKCYENFTNHQNHQIKDEEENQINEHDLVEVVTTFKCKICPFSSQDKSELLSHLQDTHVNPNKELKVRVIFF